MLGKMISMLFTSPKCPYIADESEDWHARRTKEEVAKMRKASIRRKFQKASRKKNRKSR